MADYGHDLLFGGFITPGAQPPQQPVVLARACERAGLDLVTFQDHPYQPAFLDTWTLLSYVAGQTSTIRLAPNVLNVALRQPAVVARSAASLDALSGGRAELALGAGAFWDAIEAMGGRRLNPPQAVAALGQAIEIIRGIWQADAPGMLRAGGEFHHVRGAKRGPAPVHDMSIWVGAYKSRMLRLTGRLADGWLPSLGYVHPADLAPGNAIIDESALTSGRSPSAVRRLLNITGQFGPRRTGFLNGPPGQWAEELAGLALADGISAFILGSDDEAMIERFGHEVAPAVRELVASERGGPHPPRPPAGQPLAAGSNGGESSPVFLWDEATRPAGPQPSPDTEYSARGRAVAAHLVEIHDHLRSELSRIRDLIGEVREGTLDAAGARSAINEMTVRQNDWTLGAYCASYCRIVTGHHTLEDEAIFPHLRSREPGLSPVIGRLIEEHMIIHEVLNGLDAALVHLLRTPGDFSGLERAASTLAETLLSHLDYEEAQLSGPLARHGFYPGQL